MSLKHAVEYPSYECECNDSESHPIVYTEEWEELFTRLGADPEKPRNFSIRLKGCPNRPIGIVPFNRIIGTTEHLYAEADSETD